MGVVCDTSLSQVTIPENNLTANPSFYIKFRHSVKQYAGQPLQLAILQWISTGSIYFHSKVIGQKDFKGSGSRSKAPPQRIRCLYQGNIERVRGLARFEPMNFWLLVWHPNHYPTDSFSLQVQHSKDELHGPPSCHYQAIAILLHSYLFG
jgi:hypothetical protein